MAKSDNPMQAHHRQKRQKEVQKNKQQRIKARDEKVVQTKTLSEVQEEIRKVKQRKNLQLSEQQKLQRLEKELKLLKAAAAAATTAGQPKTQLQQEPVKPLTELDDPRKSVYYDEKLNPYGAPPPGKPRLYHQRGGGVTMDIRFAVVPGEELPPPPPPALPSRPPQNFSRTQESYTGSRPHHSFRNTPPSDQKQNHLHLENSNDKNSEIESGQKDKETLRDAPLVAPTLPPPSKAVQRVRRGKPSVDIWASNDEVEYERRANQVDLEADDIGAAATKPKPKKKKSPLEIYYQDRSGQVQGPYPKAQMQGWLAAGFFLPNTMVKTNRNDTWLPIAELPALQQEEPSQKQGKDRERNISALKQGNTIEDRIAALKKEPSVEERIAALRQQDHVTEAGSDDTSSHVQDRIATLRAVQVPQSEDADAHLPLPPLQKNKIPPPYPMDDDNDDLAYPVDEDLGPQGTGEGGMSPPPPYPFDGDDMPGAAPYPIAEEPLDYPIDDGDEAYTEGVTYPANTPYQVPDEEEYPITDTYPVIDNYPTTADVDIEYPAGSTNDNTSVYPMPSPQTEQQKKVVKVDKEVVAFMPSHLHNRKRKSAAQISTKPKKIKQVMQPQPPQNKDYDKFMEEIEDLDVA